MQMGHVGCDQELDMPVVGTVGADEWRDSGGAFAPVSAATRVDGAPGREDWACDSTAFSGSFVEPAV